MGFANRAEFAAWQAQKGRGARLMRAAPSLS
jgi:hypothetical protein